MQILYKTRVDDPLAENRASFYQIMVKLGSARDEAPYFVVETHGWFDEQNEQAIHPWETLRAPFTNETEANARKEQQVRHRVVEGFVHSYQIDPFGSTPGAFIYNLLAP